MATNTIDDTGLKNVIVSPGFNNVAMGHYSIAIGRPAMAGQLIKRISVKGLTRNYETLILQKKDGFFIAQEYVGKIFMADINIYDNMIQVYLTNNGYTELRYSDMERFAFCWDILDRHVLTEKTGFYI